MEDGERRVSPKDIMERGRRETTNDGARERRHITYFFGSLCC